MSDRTEAILNLALLVGLSVLGIVSSGPIYVMYIAGAVAIYYVVSGFIKPRAPGRALTVGLGCAWGWLSIVNGVLRAAPISIFIGAMAFIIWLGPQLIEKWRTK